MPLGMALCRWPGPQLVDPSLEKRLGPADPDPVSVFTHPGGFVTLCQRWMVMEVRRRSLAGGSASHTGYAPRRGT